MARRHLNPDSPALLGFIQMSLSAGASALAGLLLDDTPRPMLWLMVLISLLATGLALLLQRMPRD